MDSLCRVFKTRQESESENEARKLLASVRKRLQQIKRLEGQRASGQVLDEQQAFKIAQRAALEQTRMQLEAGASARCAPFYDPLCPGKLPAAGSRSDDGRPL